MVIFEKDSFDKRLMFLKIRKQNNFKKDFFLSRKDKTTYISLIHAFSDIENRKINNGTLKWKRQLQSSIIIFSKLLEFRLAAPRNFQRKINYKQTEYIIFF